LRPQRLRAYLSNKPFLSPRPDESPDAFASDLILPNYLLGPRLRRIKRPMLAAAREIADEYSASLTATLLKMTVLNLCVPKTLSVLMEQWNHLSWRNDRAAPFRFGRPGLAIQVEVAA
jgi:hypothetical protein